MVTVGLVAVFCGFVGVLVAGRLIGRAFAEELERQLGPSRAHPPEFDQLELTACSQCGVAFAVPRMVLWTRQHDGETFYCPNGHGNQFDPAKVRASIERESLHRAMAAKDRRIAALESQLSAPEQQKGADAC